MRGCGWVNMQLGRNDATNRKTHALRMCVQRATTHWVSCNKSCKWQPTSARQTGTPKTTKNNNKHNAAFSLRRLAFHHTIPQNQLKFLQFLMRATNSCAFELVLNVRTRCCCHITTLCFGFSSFKSHLKCAYPLVTFAELFSKHLWHAVVIVVVFVFQ